MYKILRIICCVISVLLVAACVFVFVYAGTVWGIATIVGAAAFFALTMVFRSLQTDKEKRSQPLEGDTEEEQTTKEE